MVEPYASIADLAQKLCAGDATAVQAAQAQLDRIARLDGTLNSFAEVFAEEALAEAASVDAARKEGQPLGPIAGVPVAIKDLCQIKDKVMGVGSPHVFREVSKKDATVVARLRQAEAVILGRLQMTEGAFGQHHPDVAAPRNPWGEELWSGASSSGSGVAVASGLCFGAIGTDTGGSIRFPSGANGISGLKPTAGRVSVGGVFPLAPSLDTVGTMARSVDDVAVLYAAIAGPDSADPLCLPQLSDPVECAKSTDLSGIVIGFDPAYLRAGTCKWVVDANLAALDRLSELNAVITEVQIPDPERLTELWYPVTAVEAVLSHDAHTTEAECGSYGPYFSSLLEFGRAVPAADVVNAERERRIFQIGFNSLFADIDCFLCPSVFRAGIQHDFLSSEETPAEDIQSLLRFTVPFNFSGNPCLTLPCGFTDEDHPISLQLIGPPLAEAVLLHIGCALESVLGAANRHPEL